MRKHTELWDGIKNPIKCNSVEKRNDKPSECEKDFMIIKFNSDDNLPLNKLLKLHNLAITVRSVFEEDSKYYPQIALDKYFYLL